MDIKSMKQLVEFFQAGNFLHQFHDGLGAIQRWKKFFDTGQFRKQSSFEHTLDTSLLTILVIEKLAPHYPHMDKYALLACANLHEIGEIKLKSTDPGDILWDDKQNNNDHVLQELDVFFRFTHGILDSDLILKLLELYLLQYSHDISKVHVLEQGVRFSKYASMIQKYKFESRVFDAIEKLGYVLDVVRQYVLTPSQSFVLLLKVLHNQHQKLEEYGLSIKGFDYFYSLDIDKKIKQLLKEYPKKMVDDMLLQS